MFQFHPEITPEQIDDCFRGDVARWSEKSPACSSVEHGPYDSPEGLNDGFTHGFVMTFDTAASRDAYLPHPEHERVKDIVVPRLARVIGVRF